MAPNGNGNSNSNASSQQTNVDVERKKQELGPLIRSPFRALVQDFSPIWFTWCMNSGILGILLHQHPYQFDGIRTLSIIAFVIDVVLFILFTCFLLLRFAMFRSQAFYEITNDPGQLPLLACWAIGWLTLAPLISLNISQAYWGGYWACMLAYVMWWIGVLFTFTILFFVFATMIRRNIAGGQSEDKVKNNTHTNPLPTLIIIPAVGVATVALTGAVVAAYSNHMNARLAVPLIIMAFPLLGLGLILALILYATLWRQMMESGFPPPEQITSLFVLVGPMGQTAAALQALGTAATAWFGHYNEGPFITAQSAQATNAACVMVGLLLLGPAAFFTLFGIYGVIDCAISTRQVSWTPSWNAVIFPVATMTTATTFFSNELNSGVFKVLTSIQLIALCALYLVNVGFTFVGIFKGELLIVKEDPRVKQKMEELEKEK